MAERISQPSCTPIPRNERTEVLFALSYDDLKIKSTSSAAQISAILFAMRQTNFSDSITHGPRINAGRFPPMATLPTCNGFGFTVITYSACHPEPRRRRGTSQLRETLRKLARVTNHRVRGSSLRSE